MLVAAILIPLLGLALLGLVNLMVPKAERGRMLGVLLAGYFLRLVLFLFVMRSVAFFSHGVAGGDSIVYQTLGSMICQIWRSTGVHFVTAAEFNPVGSVPLLVNALALMEYVGGEPSPLGGTALTAFIACWTVLLFYRFVLDEGTDVRSASLASTLLLFGPSFLYHTSDIYKDGLNAFLVLASILGSIRLAKRFEWTRLGYLGLSLVALWYVRSYMVFMCLTPLVVGVLGSKDATAFRRVAAFFLVIGLAAGAAYTGALGSVFGAAERTFEHATSEHVMRYNAELRGTGSGVMTDSFVVRLLYTLFAPFPWQSGSFGLQLGKIEALLLYYFMWRAFRGRRELFDKHRMTTVMLLTFIIPGTLAYAATMSNIGLIVRQRMPIVIGIAILAALTMSEARARSDASRTSRLTPPVRPRPVALPARGQLPPAAAATASNAG
jgi:hypothetical protein